MTRGAGNTLCESFDRARAATLRAIADRPEVLITFREKPRFDNEEPGVCLRSCPASPNSEELRVLRGEADAAAVVLRYHDPDLHRTARPHNKAAAAIFDALEIARCEMLGARDMPGIAANLAARLEVDCRAHGFTDTSRSNEAVDPLALSLLVRRATIGAPWPKDVDWFMRGWLAELDVDIRKKIQRLASSLDNQRAYARDVRSLIEASGLDCQELTTQTDENVGSVSIRTKTPGNRNLDPEPDEQMGNQGRQATSTAEMAEVSEADASPPADDAGTGPAAPVADAADHPRPRAPDRKGDGANDSERVAYRAFTVTYDGVFEPQDLREPRQLKHWRDLLDREMVGYRRDAIHLASRLQRRLLSWRPELWDYELEDGILDTERLASMVADRHSRSFCKAARHGEFPDTVLTLLIDSSASMRGLPIRLAAICADVVAAALERCAIKVEILGFTTREWHGGQSREQWLAQGRPEEPGRLNDLCHIVYKSASASWRRTRNGLGLLMDEALLKENIDGEALQWAYTRLRMRRERRRILLVLTDGAPADRATSSANVPGYLENHLRSVIGRIEGERKVELVAIGLSHDVQHYYRHSATLTDPRELSQTVIRSLDTLLQRHPRSLTMRWPSGIVDSTMHNRSPIGDAGISGGDSESAFI